MLRDRFRQWLFLAGFVLFVMGLACSVRADDAAPPAPVAVPEPTPVVADTFKPTPPTDQPEAPAVPPPAPEVNPSPQTPAKKAEAEAPAKAGIPQPLAPISVLGGVVPVVTTHPKLRIEMALDHLGQRLGNGASWLMFRHGLKAHTGFTATGPSSSAMFASASASSAGGTILHTGSTRTTTTTTTTTDSVAHAYAIAPGAAPVTPAAEPREPYPSASPQSQEPASALRRWLRR